MRRIIRRREIVDDDVRYSTEEGASGLRLVHPLADLLGAAGENLDEAPIAVLLGVTDELQPLASFLGRIDLVVVDFPKVGEGRGFSQGRMLRQRYGYRGELRARGAIKRDQLFFLARCGFDSFELDPAEDPQQSLAAFNTFTVAYQDGNESLVHVRQRSGAA